jgi:hypothetical protein
LSANDIQPPGTCQESLSRRGRSLLFWLKIITMTKSPTRADSNLIEEEKFPKRSGGLMMTTSMIAAVHFTRGRITRFSFQSLIRGPIVRCSISQRCILAEPFEKQKAASKRKGVVGSSGRNKPRNPNPTAIQPPML